LLRHSVDKQQLTASNRNREIYRAPLKSQAHQGTSLFIVSSGPIVASTETDSDRVGYIVAPLRYAGKSIR